jgi:hypothetical protein
MVRVALRLYRLGVRVLLPRALRDEFGDELLQTVAARLAGTRGVLGPWRALLAELWDLARTGVRERRSARTRGLEGPPGRHSKREARMSWAWGDLRTSARSLARRPALAAGVALTIGLGIGATTTIYSVVDGVVLRPLPYEDASRLVAVGARAGASAAAPDNGAPRVKQQ